MAEITASLVKELREKTGAGMMECKKALTECNADMEAAVDWLRKKGLSVAAKKAGRVAAQGLVGVKSNDKEGAVVEVNIETDFAAKNPDFQAYVKEVVDTVLSNGDLEAKKAQLPDLVAKIGENMNLRRTARVAVDNGIVASYIHTQMEPGLGKIGVLVGLKSDASADKLQEIAKHIAMHIAAAAPKFKDIAGVDPAALEREKAIYVEKARASGKPEAIIEKIVEGNIRKYYEDVVLMEQAFIMDPDKKIKDVLADAAKELGTAVELTDFARFALGEGIEKKEEDFAAEVAAQMNK
ncbi:MAG: translation elongation factor Ts [Alphaproteobacteria bacterium]